MPARTAGRSSNDGDELDAFLSTVHTTPTDTEPDELDAFLKVPPPAARGFTDASSVRVTEPQPYPVIDQKTGQVVHPVPFGAIPVLDSAHEGIPQLGRGAKHLVSGEGGRMNAASDIIEGTLKTAEPAMVGAAIVNPIAAARMLAAGTAAQKATEAVGRRYGADPSLTRLASNVAGLAVPGALEAGVHAPGTGRAPVPEVERPPVVAEPPVVDELSSFLQDPREQPVIEPPPVPEPPAPIENVVDRIRDKVAAGEPLGTLERRKDFAERQRVEEVRRAAPPADELDTFLNTQEEPHAPTVGEQPPDDLAEHLGTEPPREPEAVAEADHRDRPGGGAPEHGAALEEAQSADRLAEDARRRIVQGSNAEAAEAGTGELAPGGGAEPHGAEGGGLQPERSPADRRAARKAARDASRAEVAQYEQDDLDSLVAHAQAQGHTGDAAALRAEFASHLQDFKDLHAELEDSGQNGRTLLKAIAKAGGISVAKESAQKGEIAWLKEFRDLKPSASRRNLNAPAVAADSMRGVRGVFRERGKSLDGILEYLGQDPRFNHIRTINDLHEAIRTAATEAHDTQSAMDSLRTWVDSREWRTPEAEPSELAGGEQAPVDELADWFKEQAASESAPTADVLDTGEEQPRLPEAGQVREHEIATPEFEAPFSLNSEAAKPTSLQESLFKPEKPTFGKTRGGGLGKFPLEERGTDLQSTILPGAKEFVEQDLGPAARATADTIKRAADDMQRAFAVDTRSPEAGVTGGIIRARAAELAHRTVRAEHAMKEAGKLFDRRAPAQNLAFIDDIEQGRPTDQPAVRKTLVERAGARVRGVLGRGRVGDESAVHELQPLQQALRRMLDGRRREVRARGRLNQVIQDYFPHIWKDPNGAKNWMRGLFGKKPLQGPKNFLKKRSIATTADGIAAGLEPVSTNPVTLTLLKIREMDKWITGHDALEDMKAAGVAKYVPVGTEAPEGWVKINDPIGTVYGNPNVPIHEAVDASVWDGLHGVAEALGIRHERTPKIKGGPRGAWGLSFTGQSRVATKFGGSESILAHEIGHQIDEKFGLWNALQALEKKYKAEGYEDWSLGQQLRDVTDLSWEGKEPSQVSEGFKQYVRKKEEKIANMIEAYVHAPEKFKKVAPDVFNVLDELVDTTPALQPLRDIKPGLRLSAREDTTRVGGMVVNGHWWAPAEGAQVLNQHLAPGLAGNALFDVYRTSGNLITQAKFALSTFHALFEASESVLSKAALAMQYGTPRRLGGAGEPLLAAKKAGEIVVAPFVDYFRGAKALREYYTQDPIGQVDASQVDQIIQGGGRVKWDDFYKSTMAKSFVEAMRQGNYPGAALRAPFAAMEALAHPIMGHLVPRLKVGAYLDLARYELRRLPSDATQADVQRVLGRAWDSIDNRFGELVYDNLFWPKWIKDVGQVGFRALGWNVGTVREVGGAARDVGKYAGALATGKTPEMTPKMAYGLALGAVGVLFQGTAMQYLLTGEKPRDVKDMIFPRTGRQTPSGHDERLKLWSYAGDIYEAAHHPASTVRNKLHDQLTAIVELAENRDWKGVQIHDPEASAGEQAKQVGQWALKKVEPISMSNARRANDAGRSGVASYVGVGTAPAWLSQSPAEQMMYDFTRSEDTRTLKQEAAGQQRQELRQDVRSGDMASARELAHSGTLGRRSILTTARTARLTALEAGFKRLTLDQALQVFDIATPEERTRMRPLLSVKITNTLKNAPPNDIPQLRARIQKARDLPVAKPFALKPAAGQ